MSIILTPEGSITEGRWAAETPYLADLVTRCLAPRSGGILLDYGCGIGRLAKEAIRRHGCRIAGADISPSMRALVVPYVGSDLFFSCAPAMLDLLIERGLRFDGAISVWVLQHCEHPAQDIERIRRALTPGADLFIVNNRYRAVPMRGRGWANDGIDIMALLTASFELQETGALAIEPPSPSFTDNTFWAHLRARP
jgi:SAM-dependent methyltransferase